MAQAQIRPSCRKTRQALALRSRRGSIVVRRTGKGGVTLAHIEDRWFRTVIGDDEKSERVKTSLYGKGMRYRVRYIDVDRRERSKSFPDRQKRAAEDFLTEVESRKLRGQSYDPEAGRITFATYAQSW